MKKNNAIAKARNKYNTQSGGERSDQYENLEKLVMKKAIRYHGNTSYFVTTIRRNADRFDRPFTLSDKETGTRVSENELIREINGVGFYELDARERDAVAKLLSVIPDVIDGIRGTSTEAPDGASLGNYFRLAFEG